MPERVTTKGVSAKQINIHREHDCTDADAKRSFSTRRIDKPKRLPHVVSQNKDKKKCNVQKVAVNVLHDEREGTLAEISFARLPHCARRRVCPKGFVISAAVVITGEPKSARRPQNQKRRRKQQPRGPPTWFWSQPTVRRVTENFRRIKRRDIVAKIIMGSLKC